MHRNWKNLIKPKNVEMSEASATYGRFVAAPLEKGFGVSIGNALRRVLLSSINGSAIVGVRIEGMEHEFSTISGVKEDVTDIVLNLKQVNLRYLGEGDTEIVLHKKGAGVVRAGDIEVPRGDVEILNPDHVICTLNEEGEIRMQMDVRYGRGYVSAERIREMSQQEDAQPLRVGTIPIDAMYAPVRRVAYSTSNVRVGQDTDYDKLTMEIWTSGAVRPEEALAYAAKILKDQLSTFIHFDDGDERLGVGGSRSVSDKVNDQLYRTVDSLELSVRAANCLEGAGIRYVGELVTRSETEMLKTKNFGRKSLNEIKDVLLDMGLSLGMKIEGFDPNSMRQA